MPTVLRVTKIRHGEYLVRTVRGEYVIVREDAPSLQQVDDGGGLQARAGWADRVWYVLTKTQFDTGRAALPEAIYEASTLRACRAWIDRKET